MRTILVLLAVVPVAACVTVMPPGPEPTRTAPAEIVSGSDNSTHRLPRRNDRARVVFPAGPSGRPGYVVGWVYSLKADTLVLARGPQVDTILLRGGRQLQVAVGSTGAGATGATIGGVVGGVIGAVVGVSSYSPCTSSYTPCVFKERSQYAAFIATLGGGAGALVGYLVGSSVRTEQWETIELPPASLNFRPSGVSLRISF